jgi:hypothetical protein
MVTPEHASATPRWLMVAFFVGLAVFLASGLVLALSWAVDFPPSVLALAWTVAAAAALVVVVGVWTDSRRAGVGYFRSVGRSLRALGRFILDFF